MKTTPPRTHLSSISNIVWPALPPPAAPNLLPMQFQLEQSQWWTADQLLAQQFRQLHALLMHAWESIPFYRERLKVARFNPRIAVTPETFSQIPLLSRSDVQKGGAALLCRQLPHGHGEIHEGTTSGSTGRPLKYWGPNIPSSSGKRSHCETTSGTSAILRESLGQCGLVQKTGV